MVERDTTEYDDSTPFDGSKLQDLQTISTAIRHKMYGKDVREGIADKQVSLSSYQLENRKAAEVVKQLRATVTTQNGQIITLNNKNKEMQIAVTAQQETINKLQADIDNADLAGIADRLDTLSENTDKLATQINSLSYVTPETIRNVSDCTESNQRSTSNNQ